MKKTIIMVYCLLLLGVGCGTETPAQNNAPEKQPTGNNATGPKPQGALKTEVRIIPPNEAPVIGGTERDKLGDGEECIVNGDCKEEGFMCKDGTCVQPQI